MRLNTEDELLPSNTMPFRKQGMSFFQAQGTVEWAWWCCTWVPRGASGMSFAQAE